jgi:hypothetical protein
MDGRSVVRDPLGEGGAPYRVPAGNPVCGGSGGSPLAWAYGLRNPQTPARGRASDGNVISLVNPSGNWSDSRLGTDANGELYVRNTYDRVGRRVAAPVG